MVKKLLKHEMMAYLRTLLPMYFVLLGVAALGRFVQLFEADTDIYNIVFGSSVFAFAVAIIVSIVLTFIFIIIRFYRNLFSGEGYLSFTLPVTPAAHIWVKALAGVVFQVATILTAVVSFAVFTAGDVCIEVLKAIGYLCDDAFEIMGTHFPIYIAEIIVLLLVVFLCEYLLFYTCIAIGQTAHKNRALTAVGVYFAYYMITQVIGTVFIVLMTVFYDVLPIDAIMKFTEAHAYESIHIGFAVLLLWYILMAVLYFTITHFILKNKLNLE